MAGAVGAITVTTFNIIDFIGVATAPSNPTSGGKGRLYFSTADSELHCLTSTGASCLSSGGGGAPGGSIGDIQFNNGAGAFTNAAGIHSGATARLSNLTGAMTLTASAGMNFTAGTTMNFSSVGTLTMASSGAAALLEGSSASLVGDSAGVTITATSNFIRLNGVGVVNQINGSASNPAESFSGTAFTGGSGTTTFPLILVGGGAAVTTWSTAGTYIGFDADSGFTGNFFDAHVNGGASVAKLTAAGALTITGPITCGANSGTSCQIVMNGGTSSASSLTVSPTGATITAGGAFAAAASLAAATAYNLNGRLMVSATAPTIATGGCGGSGASITHSNGTAAFEINVGATPTSAGCTITMPGAPISWVCNANDQTTQSATVFVQKQTGADSTTSVTIQTFAATGSANAPTASDIYHLACSPT